MKKVILLVTLFYGYKKIKDLANKQKSFNKLYIGELNRNVFKELLTEN